ncbi:multidrug efflux SMR transporter [Spirosoma terrae]|nr:multidrug efflux SMR transporter [Spirosoma terrae]
METGMMLEDDLPRIGNNVGTTRLHPRKDVMAWVFLTLAGILEVVWADSMKQSEGFTRLIPSLITLVAMLASFGLLSVAMRTLPLGSAYTIWTGIGAVGAFVVGIIWLGEGVSLLRIVAALLILAGIVLMKLSAPN